MSMKMDLRILFLALIVAGFTSHCVWGEEDYYRQKDVFIMKCMGTIKIGTPYEDPIQPCIRAVGKYDMKRICNAFTFSDQLKVSMMKTVLLAYVCHKPIPIGEKCGSKCLSLYSSIYHKKNHIAILCG
ncbi:hypothetical protein HU200_042623 [Digitaria exilis]|uniref:Uncharacterized protein n=1 Tax=Digitaria exilis TaxID=1010633 RepID=A0A835B4I5_9POAL|nr:hypothetical protein HU200_042623 [Digitaria exilis]